MVQSQSSVPMAGSGTAGQGPHTARLRLFGGHVILAEASAEPPCREQTARATHGSCRGQQGQGLHHVCTWQLHILCQPCVPEQEHWA